MLTGASSGIGRALARLLAQRGLELVLVARRADRLEELGRELSGQVKSHVVVADLGTGQSPPELAATLAHAPPVEVLINNAGCGCYAPFLEIPAEEAQRLLRLNFEAPAALTRQILPLMLRRGRGHVINVGSIATKMGPWGHSAYAAAKSALVALTQSLACEYESRGVHFSYVNPGIVATEFFGDPGAARLWRKVRRHAVSASYAAQRIVRLLDRPRLELCIPRHYRVMDWIEAVSPRLLQRLVARSSAPRESICAGGPPTAAAAEGSRGLGDSGGGSHDSW